MMIRTSILRPTGRRSPTDALAPAVVLVLVLALAVSAGPARGEADSVLLPGVDISEIALRSGAWCRYQVFDEAMGEVDSSSFYIAVLDREVDAGEDCYWVEIETGPLGVPAEERDVTRALISADINDFARGDSLYHYVHRLYIKKGGEPVQPADPSDLKRLILAHPTSDEQWTRQPGVTVSTPIGDMTCDLEQMTVEDSRRIPTGNVTLVRHNIDRFRVWTSDTVPVFGLVKCIIDRSRESRTVPRVPGIPDAGPRESRTTAVVVGFGDEARSLLSSP